LNDASDQQSLSVNRGTFLFVIRGLLLVIPTGAERPAVLQTYPGNPEYDAQTEFRNDVPGAEVHVLEAGHFALDTKADEIAALVRSFMDTRK
jgi:hypothetical protein